MDRGRNAAGFKFNLRSFDEALDADVRYRNVHKHSGKYVESALRAETTYKATEKFTSKILGYYKHLPRTHAKYDPLIYAKTMYSLTDYFRKRISMPKTAILLMIRILPWARLVWEASMILLNSFL